MINGKPTVGLTPLLNLEEGRLWMMPNYINALTAAGAVPVILPLAADAEAEGLASLCDGYLFTGGPDVHPARYGEETLRSCGAISMERDTMEIGLLHGVFQKKKPVLGVCRGIQMINVAMGGSLYQDIPTQAPGPGICHDQRKPYETPVHSVKVEAGSLLSEILGKEQIQVNSMHHQAIRELAPGLRACAHSFDGMVEAVELPGAPFLLAVQWHPEHLFSADPLQMGIFRAFVKACRERARMDGMA